MRQRQKVQVVISEYRNGAITKVADETQGLERLIAPTDQIATEPDAVPVRGKRQSPQQCLQ